MELSPSAVNITEGDILCVDKPAGLTSFGVVARVRRVLSEYAGHKVKVGHAGTLDPFATGLMILGVGKGTKRMGEFLKLDKEYVATVRLGEVSTTGDPEGEITAFVPRGAVSARASLRGAVLPSLASVVTDCESPLGTNAVISDGKSPSPNIRCNLPSGAQVEEVLAKFTGEIEQVPPVYSAIKIDGQRAYKLARKGVEVEMPKRRVKIYEIELLDYAWPELKVRVACSSGTYIRTLAQDIGEALGVGAYCSALRRTKIGDYSVEGATIIVNDRHK
jgi:tRNA pseudouridine55 synthase